MRSLDTVVTGPSFLFLQGPNVPTCLQNKNTLFSHTLSLSAPHLSLAPLRWGLWRQLAVRAGLCSIKTRPHLICHLFHCKYTLYVHTVLCSPWVLRPAVLSALAQAYIRFFKAEYPWTIIKCLFSASSAYIQPLSSLNENVNINDFWLFINPKVLFKDTQNT